MKALIYHETGEPNIALKTGRNSDSTPCLRRSASPSTAQPDQRLGSTHGARALRLSAGIAGQPGH